MQTQKLILSLIVVMQLITLSGCKKNEAPAKGMDGRWYVQLAKFQLTRDGQSLYGYDEVPAPGAIAPDYFEFHADGTYRADLVTGLVTGRWAINGTKLLLTGASKFELSNDGFDILKLTDNEFEFTDTYFPVFETQNSGEDHPYKGAKAELTYYLKKR